MRVCALVNDLMDRSRISASIADVVFVRDAAACAGADVVIVDLARSGDAVGALRTALPHAAIVAFGPHVDESSAAAAPRPAPISCSHDRASSTTRPRRSRGSRQIVGQG